MVHARKPENFPPEIRIAVDRALEGEVLLPFRTQGTLKRFRATVLDYLKSQRLHKTPLAERLKNTKAGFYMTDDLALTRPEWKPGPDYPYTLLLDFRPLFEDAIANMQVTKVEREAPHLGRDKTVTVLPTHHVAPPLDDDPLNEYLPTDEERERTFAQLLGDLDETN